jgi:hypothetical protein
VFRVGQIALEYDSERAHLALTLTELLGEGQGTPRRVCVSLTPEQARALAQQGRCVAQRGRT